MSHLDSLDLIGNLPIELWTEVFTYLSASDLTSCARVCPYWNEVAFQSSLWLSLYEQALPHISWMNAQMVRNIELSGVERDDTGQTINSDERFCSQQMEKFFIQLNSASVQSKDTAVNSSEPKSPLTITEQCTMLGPAIDQPEFSENFFRSILRWVDVEACGRFLSENIPVRHSINSSWAGFGLPLRLPASKSGESFRLIILHARDKTTRTGLPYGGSRIHGSGLLRADPDLSSKFILNEQATWTLAQSNSIVYTIDLRPTPDDTDKRVSSAEDRWTEIRQELGAITSVMSERQKLVILGLQNIAVGRSVRINPFAVAKQLGGVTICEVMEQPLANATFDWRIWCTSADEFDNKEIEHLFSWLIQ